MNTRTDVDLIYMELFSDSRERQPRSRAYRRGCLAGLLRILLDEWTECPHASGTAEADAWYSGRIEGFAVGRERKDQPQQAAA